MAIKEKSLFERHKQVLALKPATFKKYDRFAQVGYALAFAFCFKGQSRSEDMERQGVALLERIKNEMTTDDWREFMREFGL